MRYPDVTAEGTLANRTSVCAGYANLFKALCDAAGVKAVYVSHNHINSVNLIFHSFDYLANS